MANHMNLFKKLHIETEYTARLTSFEKEKNSALSKFGNEFYMAKRKTTAESAVFKNDGTMIIPFDENYFLASTNDTLLIFSRRKLSIYAINVNSGDLLYSVESYSHLSGEFVLLDYKENDIELARTYAIIMDKHKRYQIYSEYGAPITDKIIDYKVYTSPNGRCYYLALRFEDSFGIMTGDGKITRCKCIVDLDNCNAPFLAGFLDDDGKVYYNFCSVEGRIIRDYSIISTYESEYKGSYLAKVKSYENMKYNYEFSYVFIKPDGTLLNNMAYQKALPIVTNRTFIWYEGEAYGHLMDEQGRMIKLGTYQVKEIIRNFEKVEYGGFDMTLARVRLIDSTVCYIDKEFNIYPDIDNAILSEA